MCTQLGIWLDFQKRISSSHSYQSEMEHIAWVLDCTRFVCRRRNHPHARIQLLVSIVCSQIVYILLAGSMCTLKDTQNIKDLVEVTERKSILYVTVLQNQDELQRKRN